MTQIIFINLPVSDLKRSIAFYTAIGFRNEPKFTDETAAAMQLSESIVVMLITLPRWTTFTDRPLPPAGSSEVMNCLSCDSREGVDRLTETAKTAGGAADVNPAQDHGFMYGRSFTDPDDHVWEVVWMDPAAVPPAA
ncbi:VOC family protein [Novosphingobium aquae]|uniref:VOC family protein n=1 Tax=Novosphingobium aquae TaxID=3133435 RepID=A0ABU8S3G0_9SPHN